MIVRIMLLSLCFLSLRGDTVEVNQNLGLLNLPDEVLLQILDYAIVEKDDIFNGTLEAASKLRLVCREFNRLSKATINEIFKKQSKKKPLATDNLNFFAATQLDKLDDAIFLIDTEAKKVGMAGLPLVSHYSSSTSFKPNDECFKHYRVMCEYGTQK